MVLAFNASYNKETHTQSDAILMECKGKYILQERVNFLPVSEEEFDTEVEAYKAFGKYE